MESCKNQNRQDDTIAIYFMLSPEKQAIFNQLKQDFPYETDWMLEYFGSRHRVPGAAYLQFRQRFEELKREYPNELESNLRKVALRNKDALSAYKQILQKTEELKENLPEGTEHTYKKLAIQNSDPNSTVKEYRQRLKKAKQKLPDEKNHVHKRLTINYKEPEKAAKIYQQTLDELKQEFSDESTGTLRYFAIQFADSKDMYLRYLQALTELKQEFYALDVTILKTCARRSPSNPREVVIRVQQSIEELLKRFPNDISKAQAKHFAMYSSDPAAAAIAYIEKVKRLEREYPNIDARFLRFIALRNRNSEAAIARYEKYMEMLAPKYPDVTHLKLSWLVLASPGNPEKAVEKYLARLQRNRME